VLSRLRQISPHSGSPSDFRRVQTDPHREQRRTSPYWLFIIPAAIAPAPPKIITALKTMTPSHAG
jgi:hypothetical protein